MIVGGIPPLDDPYVDAKDSVVATVPIEPYVNSTKLVFYKDGVKSLQYDGSPPNTGKGATYCGYRDSDQ